MAWSSLVLVFVISFLIPIEFALTVAESFREIELTSIPETPSAPDTAFDAGSSPTLTAMGQPVSEEYKPDPSEYPARLLMPSIKLDTQIQEVGVTPSGEIDVPSGNSMSVVWYRYGPIPGEVGSAVMDAHVYAAFRKLRYLKVGSDVYVVNKGGEKMHFRVTDSRIYTLEEMPLEGIFNNYNGRHLNFITCARKFIPSLDTYSHRLVVYTERVYD